MFEHSDKHNFRESIGNLMILVRDLDASHLGNPPYILSIRTLLRKIVNIGYEHIEPISTAKQLTIVRLSKEIIEASRELDEMISQASLVASLNLHIPPNLLARLENRKYLIQRIWSDFTNLSVLQE